MAERKSGIVGITSPPYEEAVDGGGIFKKGYVGNFSHSKNPDTIGNRTYSNKAHNFSEGQIASLKSQPNQELDFDITKYHKCGGELYWQGCYGSETYYNQFVTPESYAHPAKISFLLVERIFKHLEHLGLLKEGMTICDFMAGSGRIPLIASMKGYDSVGVELEPHFIKMCEDNKKFAENKVGRKLNFEIIQGDSRQLSKMLNKGDVGITSPPFELSLNSNSGIWNKELKQHISFPHDSTKNQYYKSYGDNPSNIGNLPYKDLENLEFSKPSLRGMVGVVSPPYQDVNQSKKEGLGHEVNCDCNFCKKNANNFGKIVGSNYSQNPQNIGNLKDKELVGITSPPYADQYTIKEGGQVNKEYVEKRKEALIKQGRKDIADNLKVFEYNTSNPENISNLKDTQLVGITSSPYEEGLGHISNNEKDFGLLRLGSKAYGETEGQIGLLKEHQQGQSYLSAMLQVYQEAYKSGMQVLGTVTKNPTRNGKLRRLDLDTAKLIEMAGFKIFDYHRAVLFKSIEQSTLIGETKQEHKGRLSFFKRLSLAKGNKAAQFEDVLIAVRG